MVSERMDLMDRETWTERPWLTQAAAHIVETAARIVLIELGKCWGNVSGQGVRLKAFQLTAFAIDAEPSDFFF